MNKLRYRLTQTLAVLALAGMTACSGAIEDSPVNDAAESVDAKGAATDEAASYGSGTDAMTGSAAVDQVEMGLDMRANSAQTRSLTE